jgi:hypothetical protein
MNPSRHFVLALMVAGALAVALSPSWADERGRHQGKLVHVRGQITQVRPEANQVIVRTRKGEELRLTVDERSQFQQQKQAARLGDFKEGMRVRVTYDPREGGNYLVSMSEPRITLEGVQQKVTDAVNAARNYAYENRGEYRQKLEAVVQGLDERIDQLEDQIQSGSAEFRRQHAAEIEDLRRKRDAVQAKLDHIQDAAPGAWDDLKAGIGAAVNDIQNALDRARTRFQSPPRRPAEPPH